MQIFSRAALKKSLLQSLAEKPLNLDQLVDAVGAPQWVLVEVLEHLLGDGQVAALECGRWSLP